MYGPQIDSRIRDDRELVAEFVLKLPQQLYDSEAKAVTDLSSPVAKRSTFSTPIRPQAFSIDLFDATEGKQNNDDNDDSKNTSAHVPFSPGMDAGLFYVGGTKKEGYFGQFNFLHSQHLFDDCFGRNPRVYHAVDREVLWNEQDAIGAFADLCQFDVFMNLCQLYYVGDSNVNKENYVREVCANISKLTQQWRDGGKLIVLTPEELFQSFLRESTNLPDDTSTWTLQLPSQFLVALNDDITSALSQSSTFVIPSQASLRSKMDHINGMRMIKNEATKIFRNLVQAREIMRQEIAALTNKKLPAFAYGRSQAEQTLSKYQPPQDHPDVEIRIVQGTQYPFHKPSQHLSKYPVGFRGCYNCGQSDHFRTSDCKKEFNKMAFFRGKSFF